MTTLTKRTPYVKPSLSWTLYHVNGLLSLEIVQTTGRQACSYWYRCEPLAADWGRAFRLTKFVCDRKPGEPAGYDLHVDAQLGASCECRGFIRWGHRGPCKHISALAALTTAGEL